ncbi:hypothetical protein JXA27_02685 [Aerococcaceae bacterium zg-B36]|uniref:hypothetical protein n=1 Tax=Aerococcaceae bacterium zg-252 TaxID=2796928 RepID=UPI001BD8BD87|nr:hypothetical protein [Aerococcaceae bacterium zg-B36]
MVKKKIFISLLFASCFLPVFKNDIVGKVSESEFTLFGRVHLEDNDLEDNSDSGNNNDDSVLDHWFESFIKTHKTPFSKMIKK